MIRFLLIFIAIFSLLQGSSKDIEKKIKQNRYILKKQNREKKAQDIKIKQLADAIINEEKVLNKINYNLDKVSNNIFLNKIKLKRAKKDIIKLSKQIENLQNEKLKIEKKIVDTIVEKYTLTITKKLIEKESLKEIIEKEKLKLLFEDTKENLLKLNLKYFKLSNNKTKNEEKKRKLENYITLQEKEKDKFKQLKKKQEKSIKQLKQKHLAYQKRLKEIIDKQYNISKLLEKLDILKKNQLQKEKLAKLKAKRLKAKREKEKKEKERLKKLKKDKKSRSKQITIKKNSNKKVRSKDIKIASKETFKEDIDLKVRNIANTNRGIKISNYKGIKISPPLKSYEIVKRFGEYFDPIYKIKLFNESISLKSKKPNAKVYSVLKGKVVYAKENAGALGNVVIIKHSNNLHSIYSQLSKIPSTIKVNRWVPKGYVVGRVKDTLVFQITKNSKYLDPEKLFKKR